MPTAAEREGKAEAMNKECMKLTLRVQHTPQIYFHLIHFRLTVSNFGSSPKTRFWETKVMFCLFLEKNT